MKTSSNHLSISRIIYFHSQACSTRVAFYLNPRVMGRLLTESNPSPPRYVRPAGNSPYRRRKDSESSVSCLSRSSIVVLRFAPSTGHCLRNPQKRSKTGSLGELARRTPRVQVAEVGFRASTPTSSLLPGNEARTTLQRPDPCRTLARISSFLEMNVAASAAECQLRPHHRPRLQSPSLRTASALLSRCAYLFVFALALVQSHSPTWPPIIRSSSLA